MNLHKRIFLIVTILLLNNCRAQKNIDSDVLNAFLRNKKISELNEKAHFNKSPSYFINMYNYWFNKKHKKGNENNEFNKFFFKNIEWIFTPNETTFLLENYQSWSVKKWEKQDVKVDSSLKISNATYSVSRPFYDKSKSKAMIIVNVNNGLMNGSTNIILLKKDNIGNWKLVGTLLVSIS